VWPAVATAASYTWNVNTAAPNNKWATNANWLPNTANPNAADDVANFLTIITADYAVDVDAARTVGTITFNSGFNYSLSGSAITFSVTSGTAQLNVQSASGNTSPTIANAVTLTSALVVAQNSTGLLTLSGVISGAGALTTGGTGVTYLNNSNSMTGGVTVSAGTLRIDSSNRLGTAGAGVTPLTISNGTLQAASPFTLSVAPTLTGSATIDTQSHAMTISSVISGSGSLTKIGSAALTLSGANTYTGGTAVNAGTVTISSDGNLGASSSQMALSGGTLQVSSTLSMARPFALTGTSTIDSQGNTLTLSGVMSGTGVLTKVGVGTLVLTGANTYSGGTVISAGTLQGNTTSLQGSIQNGTALVFNQTSAGTYAGTLTGAGSLTVQGGGTLTVSGSSASFSGATGVTAGELKVTGSLAGSAVTVSSGAVLSGTGTVGATTNSGTIRPGSSIGTLTIQGNLTLNGGSNLDMEIAPASSDLIAVSGAASLNGSLTISQTSGFFGLSSSYTLMTYASRAGTVTLSLPSSNMAGSLTYNATSLVLNVTIPQPFLNFPFGNSNEAAVGHNINALNQAGLIGAGSDLATVINSLRGASDDTVNDALDQMHPAIFGAFAELQTEVSSQLIALFHRRPDWLCGCNQKRNFWIEPFGNWLTLQSEHKQVGFRATTGGVAVGLDGEIADGWILGFGGAWNGTNVHWRAQRGHADMDVFYGALYTDYMAENYSVGAALLIGRDNYETTRDIRFTTIDRQSKAHYHGLDVTGQLTAAYYFGSPACQLFPYLVCDYLYLRNNSFQESGADSLSLHVDATNSSTLRAETGLAFRFTDRNYNDTICISPLFGAGYVLEWPMHRSLFTARFNDEPISYNVEGWKVTRQLLNLHFGLGFTYHCFKLDAEYLADIDTDGGSPYFNSRGNFRFAWSF
jgi:autotransporter-associated beta strand protein